MFGKKNDSIGNDPGSKGSKGSKKSGGKEQEPPIPANSYATGIPSYQTWIITKWLYFILAVFDTCCFFYFIFMGFGVFEVETPDEKNRPLIRFSYVVIGLCLVPFIVTLWKGIMDQNINYLWIMLIARVVMLSFGILLTYFKVLMITSIFYPFVCYSAIWHIAKGYSRPPPGVTPGRFC